MDNPKREPQESRLTDRMDMGTEGFDRFQAILSSQSKEQSEIQKQKIALLSIRYKMEDYLYGDLNLIRSAGEFKNYSLILLRLNKINLLITLG